MPYAHDVSVLLHTSLAQARRRIPPSAGTLTEAASGVRLATRAEHLGGAAQLLAGLRAEVRALAARLLSDAGPGA